MNANPYQSPATASAAAELAADAALRVEGKQLVVRSGAVLPPVCVKTNEPIAREDYLQKRFTWCSPAIGLLILISGFLLVLVYFIARKKCSLTFGLTPAVRRKYRNRKIIKIVAAIVLFFALPVAAGADSGLLLLIVFLLFLTAVFSLFFGNSPLAVTKQRNGEFWISGCSKEFLARLET